MKWLLPIVALFSILPTFAQDDGIILENKDIVFQRIIECPGMNKSSIIAMIKQTGILHTNLQNIHETDDKLLINIVGMQSRVNDLEGYPVMSTDFIISQATEYSGRATYDIKEGRYRVTFTEISWRIPDTMFGENMLLRDLLYNKKGELRKRFDNKMRIALAHTFNISLCPTVPEEGTDDW